ncbi:MAG: hypothetical protein WEF86_13575 [Gemmatimonadota bacterium]
MPHKAKALVLVVAVVLGSCDYDTPSAPVELSRAAALVEAAPDTSVVAHLLPGGQHNGTQVAGAVIGAAGGSVALGDFEIIVPAGAVALPTRFSIRLPNAAQQNKLGYAYAEFGPHNVDFAVPVTLRMPHAATDAAPDAAALWWNGTGWDGLTTAYTGDGRIETAVGHFSYYGVSRAPFGFTLPGG